jgi:Fic family protein
MKMPSAPPPFDELFRKVVADPGRLIQLLQAGRSARAEERYLPWDNIRHKKAPDGVSHDEWWLSIKLARSSMQRHLPLLDKDGRPLTYALPDEVLRGIEAVNRDASGHIGISEQVTNPATRDRYLVSSLIEEAITSSQLEGASTTGQVAKDMIRSGRPPRDRDERMILNNYVAMRRIGELRSERLTPELICEIHELVTRGTLDDAGASGRLQLPTEDRVAVYGDHAQLLHLPPAAVELPARLQRLCDFANATNDDETYVPPVVRAIAVHFMLGYDHPFEDGNGRTARALFYWSMLNQGYWLTEFLSISRILRGAPAQYGRSFLYTEQDDNDLTYFTIYQLRVIQRSIAELHAYLERKMRELQDIHQSLAAMPGEFNHRQLALLQHATRSPEAQYTVQSHLNSHNVVHETARKDLMDLERRGLLIKHRLGRGFVWTPIDDIALKLRDRHGHHPRISIPARKPRDYASTR